MTRYERITVGKVLASNSETAIVRPGNDLRNALDDLYRSYNRSECISPDPLQFVHLYDSKLDREVVGFLASALAYGRVKQIICSVRLVLDRMGASPSSFLMAHRPSEIEDRFRFFKHRFTTGEDVSSLLVGLRKLILEYGSLENCFLSKFDIRENTIIPSLRAFVDEVDIAAGRRMPMFLPSPSQGSACKRLNLFLRWMVRNDNVDPGVWNGVPASLLVIPLDTHMHRIAIEMGFTRRKQADLRCALEVTSRFAAIRPDDPVRYDFALTRIGMNNGAALTGIGHC